MRNPLAQLFALGPELAAYILTLPLLNARGAYAITQTAVASPNLDLSQLGRVAVAGAFDSISLYAYAGQNQNAFTTNGSQALLTRYPNGAFDSLSLADASIQAMCPFVLKDGTLAGVVVGGNFTSIGSVKVSSIALFDTNTTQITALPGLSGAVNALYCDKDTSTVYVGGNFMGGNSTNAMAWTTGWVNLPFAGFNGPVMSITKNSAGNIVFAGQFDGLGNATAPEVPDGQVINIGSGNITASGSSHTTGFMEPSNIICKTGAQDGPGNTWLLQDDTRGWWEASIGMGFSPTKLRLYNTNQDGRGTKTFYFQDVNSGGILNLTYADASGQSQWCIQSCPLAQNTTAQDFHFSPSVGMSSFRIYVTDYYGSGGGLSGIEMFQDEIYSFAVSEFNKPQCDGVSQGSRSAASPNGTWTRIQNGPSDTGSSDYLSANLTTSSQINTTNVVFQPDLRQSGNYSITVYTPGCIPDATCSARGQVNVSVTMSANSAPITTTLYQTNNYDKYDQIYYGYVDVSGSFRPTVTLSPLSSQSVPLTVVASRVRFELITTTGGLNGLFEYNPNQVTVSTDFENSTIDAAGASLTSGALINAVAMYQNALYAAGNFSGNGISNFMKVTDNATSVAGGGLNGPGMAMYQNGSTLYVGGNFTSTADNSATDLNHIAVFSASANTWTALGAGVNNAVSSIVPLQVNVTSGSLEDCITLTGSFTSVNAFGGNASFSAGGFAVWVTGRKNWLHNIKESTIAISGDLTTFTDVPGYSSLYAGQIMTQGLGLSDAAALVGSGQPSLQSLGLTIAPAASSNGSSSSRKRALSTQGSSGKNYTGVYNGLFYDSNNLNITVLGGSFSATASNGSIVQNLVFINNTQSQAITGISGIDPESIFVAMDTQDTKLFAGGAIRGTVNGNDVQGLIVYDLAANDFVSPSPPALQGSSVIVNAIAAQPSSSAVYVGGDFDTAGSLPCATLCFYDTGSMQWNTPGTGLAGTINAMFWSSNTQLIIAGNITIGGNATTMATYDSKAQTFTEFSGASALPGPITAISRGSGDDNEYWVGGIATSNNSVYLSKYSSNTWTGVEGLGADSAIRGLQVMSLTSPHQGSSLVDSDQVVLLSGNIVLPDYGNASAVLFNGTTYQPFILTSMSDGSQGTLAGIFVANTAALMNGNHTHHLALGLVVLIGLAIALGLIFIMICAGLLLERNRRRKEGYVRMPQTATDPRSNVERINPASLFAGLGDKGAPPKI